MVIVRKLGEKIGLLGLVCAFLCVFCYLRSSASLLVLWCIFLFALILVVRIRASDCLESPFIQNDLLSCLPFEMTSGGGLLGHGFSKVACACYVEAVNLSWRALW